MIDRSAFTAVAGARNAADMLAVTTHNLANAATPGFREQLSALRAVPVLGQGHATRVSSVTATPGFSSRPGILQATGHAFDLALEGPGWFVVRRDDGSLGYTRTVELVLDASGELRVAGRGALMGEDGPMLLPPGSQPEVSEDGVVFARVADGSPPVRVGRLQVAEQGPGVVDRGPDGLYQALQPLANQADGLAFVRQGMKEASNVAPADAMVQMISVSRLFDVSMQVVRSADQNARTATQLIGPVR
jgi:flagellar basal-body rod protein FlgF